MTLGRSGGGGGGSKRTKHVAVIHKSSGRWERERWSIELDGGARLNCRLPVLVVKAALTLRSSPAGKNLRVGKLWTLTASISLAVESILATTVSALSLYFSPSFSQMGVSCLQCPHQGASGANAGTSFRLQRRKKSSFRYLQPPQGCRYATVVCIVKKLLANDP